MRFHALKDAVATGPGGAMEVGPRNSVQISGIVAGDEITMEQSIDGENWETVGAAITANGIASVDADAYLFRPNVTAVVGGGTLNAWTSNGIQEY